MTPEDLKHYDIVLCIDKSGSMNMPEKAGTNGRSRWTAAEEMAESVAAEMSKYDDNGITVCVFSSSFTEFVNITGGLEKTQDIFKKMQPGGSTDTAGVLRHYADDYFKRKSKDAATKRMMVIIVTDGTPDDEGAVENVIINTASRLSDDDEFQFHFLQIGDDQHAHDFLVRLDTGLKGRAKYDIVGVRTWQQMANISVIDAVLANDE